MDANHRYETTVVWAGGRAGSVTADGLPPVDVSAPLVFGGEAGRWTPEHLLVAAANVCLMETFLAIAGFSKLEVAAWESSATGRVAKVAGSGWEFAAIDIDVRLEVALAEDLERADRLLRKAAESCLVSRSMRAPVNVRAQVDARAAA
jgi:organic hydroperoxide reductase OsmC/OhrA